MSVFQPAYQAAGACLTDVLFLEIEPVVLVDSEHAGEQLVAVSAEILVPVSEDWNVLCLNQGFMRGIVLVIADAPGLKLAEADPCRALRILGILYEFAPGL